ncbi:MAG: PepSY-associated TM helix domain-containing protein [Pseudomonadota bacterium]
MSQAAAPPQSSEPGLKNKRPGAKASAAKKKSQRKKLYELHSWVGFHLALIMGVVLFTGTIATVSNEIDWLIQSDMRVTPGEQRVSWGAMESAIESYAPDRNIQSISDMGGDYLAFRARVSDELGNQSFVHVNQWTGEVTGETHPFTVQRFFRDLHRYLFMPGVIALPIVCSLAIVLLISLYTGLKTSRNWKTLMTRVRFNKGARILWGDAHKAAGLWSIWFFAVISITALWYLLEWGYGVAGTRMVPDRPEVVAERVAEFGPVIADRPLADIVASAKAAYPDQRITAIQYPSRASGAFTVLGTNANPVLRERANMVFIDPENASVIEVLSEHDLPLDTYLNEMADPLHFGNFGGLVTKLIWFVFGVFMTGLSFTGVWLTWRRLKSSRLTRAQVSTTPVLIAAAILGYFYVERYLSPNIAPEFAHRFAQQQWTQGASAQLFINESGGAAPYRLVLSTTGRPNLAEVELCVAEVCTTSAPGPVRGHMSIDLGDKDFAANAKASHTIALKFNDQDERILSWGPADGDSAQLSRAER